MTDYACGNCGARNAAYGSRCYECGDDWANAREVEPPSAESKAVLAEGARPCPSCQAALEPAKTLYPNASLEACFGCSRCGGVWLDNAASDLVVRRIDANVLAFASLYELTASPPAEAGTGGRVCPVGREPLVTACVKDVVLDACSMHGTWFDAGELQKVARCFEAERAAAPNALPADVRRVLETIGGAYRSSGR